MTDRTELRCLLRGVRRVRHRVALPDHHRDRR